MNYLLILTVAGTDLKHMTVHEEKGFSTRKLAMVNDTKAGIFPNAIFQQAYLDSDNRHIEEIVISHHDINEVWRNGFALIEEVLEAENRDARVFTNLGDWIGIPAKLFLPDGKSVIVTDAYKYLAMENLFNAKISVNWMDADEALKQPGVVMSHLTARDAFYDQTYVDKNGQRTFLRYEPRTDKSRESTLGANHHAATPVIVNGLEYPTIDAAALAHNLPAHVVYNRLNSASSNKSNWAYKDKQINAVTYILRHKDNPGFYIGSTSNGKQRLHTHINKLTHGGHRTPKLQAMVDKYGVDGVTYEVVFEGELDECKTKEQELVNQHWGDPNLLNSSRNTKSAISHHTEDPEVEKRRVEGLRKAVTTDEHRQKMSDVGKAQWSVPGRKEARSGAGNPFAKCVSIHGVVYGSVIDAVRAKAGGLTDWVIRTRLKAGSDPAIFYCDAEGNKTE